METGDGKSRARESEVPAAAARDDLLAKARGELTTPFDYIVIGSGAGGGPLAARLAEGGRRVLLLEAGADSALEPNDAGGGGGPHDGAAPQLREPYEIPGYHAAATEDPAMCWSYSVRHYEDDAVQRSDPKYSQQMDPSRNGKPGKGGILYPRSSGLGGCTSHHAMIVIKPNDRDWNRIAQRTGDESWGAEAMQGYFARIENCLYYKSYQGFLRKFLLVYKILMRLAAFINPRSQLDGGGHGFSGWQSTSFIDPGLVVRIAWGDWTFLRVLFGALVSLLKRNGQWRALLGALFRVQPVQFLDPNFADDRDGRSLRPAFIPVGTDGFSRTGIRERLLAVAKEKPDRLVIYTGAFARRLIFSKGAAGTAPPHAVGVEVELGPHLYEASPLHRASQSPTIQLFARREIIVCAGAFNTPQLLMLSGIGEAEHLSKFGITGPRDAAGNQVCGVVNLRGVGRNLQDRYEVSVITTASQPFSTLDGVSFEPGDPKDPARKQWLEEIKRKPEQRKRGLYTTNGGALAFLFASSKARKGVPDTFIFGAPAAFRGYYWGWAKDLLHEKAGATTERRDLWSWILLKAYTRNNDGTVRLRDSSPSAQAEINFHSFGEAAEDAGAAEDLEAVREGVELIRDIDRHIAPFNREIQPGREISGEEDLRAWIRREAWGHHACGTCRMGSDRWRASAADLTDSHAVLDSKFRVHGVSGLRIVDASIFPEIPGYFIVTPIFMVSEKAADVLLKESASYPQHLEAAEAASVRKRRCVARVAVGAAPGASESDRLPNDTVGLALSGGGVRSATFCLGVLQGLASSGRLALVDMLSTVSGGGYIGGFLGRLYTRMMPSVVDPAQRVREILSDVNSAEVWWLRTNARYLTGAGLTDLEDNTGTIWRNLLAVHVWIGTLIIGLEAALCWLVRMWQADPLTAASNAATSGIPWSPWWWVPASVVVIALVPAWLSFWLSPAPGTRATVSLGGLLMWLVALAGAIAALGNPATFYLPYIGIAALLFAWVWLEAAQWGVYIGNDDIAQSSVVRNRLTRGAAIALGVFVLTLLWAVIDTLANYVVEHRSDLIKWTSAIMGLIAASLPSLRSIVEKAAAKATASSSAAAAASARAVAIATLVQSDHVREERSSEDSGDGSSGDAKLTQTWRTVLLAAIGFILVAFMVFGLDVIAHLAFRTGFGNWLLIFSLALSIAIGRASGFVNLSSLQSLYAARLARTYLGAANEARVRGQGDPEARDVASAHPKDDLFLHRYHPERQGGPLHLINVCVNQTVEPTSGRQLKEDKGLPMCLGPAGVSVGLAYHALWERASSADEQISDRLVRGLQNPGAPVDEEPSAVRALRVAPDPNAFHVLASRKRAVVEVEPLRLSQWMSISGAALSTGEGRLTSLPMSFLLGLFNVRLGYWWNSNIKEGDRPGYYPPSFWRRIKSLPGLLFRTQRAILNEWRAYFTGPSHKLWYLSDGGHYDNTGLYELLRRRLPFIIAVDSDCDPQYTFSDLAILVRIARMDFEATVTWLDPTDARRAGDTGWAAFAKTTDGAPVPTLVRDWLSPDALGPLDTMERRGPFAAALARIDYRHRVEPTWLVLMKASLPSHIPLPIDLRSYAELNGSFPNQTTVDQFFTDDQWESYRLLGQTLASALFTARQP